MNPKVDIYFVNLEKWLPELSKLREIILSCELKEELKWGSPTYSVDGKNIIAMRGFKEHFAIWFFKGVFLKDKHQILIQSTESTLGLRQIRFKTLQEIIEIETFLREYIFEAIDIEKAGFKVEQIKETEIQISTELQSKFDLMPELKEAFDSLTLGRKKEYARYCSEAKQQKTRDSRVEKCIPLILNRKGLNDKYIC